MARIYDKPTRILIKEMLEEFALNPGQTFTKQQTLEWFARRYPKISKGTIHWNLSKISTNFSTRRNWRLKPAEDDVLFQVDRDRFRLFDPERDPPPIHPTADTDEEQPPEVEAGETSNTSEFAYERDLQNFLSKNLSVIEDGLRLYQNEDGEVVGIEYPVGRRSIDILAVDSSDSLVVIELKVSRGYDRVVGQLMRYMAWIRNNQAEAGQQVRGVIIARKISEDLLLACSEHPQVQLFEYEMSLTLKSVSTKNIQ